LLLFFWKTTLSSLSCGKKEENMSEERIRESFHIITQAIRDGKMPARFKPSLLAKQDTRFRNDGLYGKALIVLSAAGYLVCDDATLDIYHLIPSEGVPEHESNIRASKQRMKSLIAYEMKKHNLQPKDLSPFAARMLGGEQQSLMDQPKQGDTMSRTDKNPPDIDRDGVTHRSTPIVPQRARGPHLLVHLRKVFAKVGCNTWITHQDLCSIIDVIPVRGYDIAAKARGGYWFEHKFNDKGMTCYSLRFNPFLYEIPGPKKDVDFEQYAKGATAVDPIEAGLALIDVAATEAKAAAEAKAKAQKVVYAAEGAQEQTRRPRPVIDELAPDPDEGEGDEREAFAESSETPEEAAPEDSESFEDGEESAVEAVIERVSALYEDDTTVDAEEVVEEETPDGEDEEEIEQEVVEKEVEKTKSERITSLEEDVITLIERVKTLEDEAGELRNKFSNLTSGLTGIVFILLDQLSPEDRKMIMTQYLASETK
jgi:hypothetical protein